MGSQGSAVLRVSWRVGERVGEKLAEHGAPEGLVGETPPRAVTRAPMLLGFLLPHAAFAHAAVTAQLAGTREVGPSRTEIENV